MTSSEGDKHSDSAAPADPSPVNDADVLLRRFNPKDESHWTVDEATGLGRMRSGALRFDEEPAVGKGCSVYQASILATRSLTRASCLELPDWRLAEITASAVRSLRREHKPEETSPFDAVQDPFPSGEEGAHARDAAHALITHTTRARGMSRWYKELAGAFAPA